jgi:hypothetical protein
MSQAKRLIAVAAFAVVLAGCVTPAQTFTFERSREYSASKDVVWERLMRYFATNSIQIKTLEKASGVVYAERQFSGNAPVEWSERGRIGDLADCGKDFMAIPEMHAMTLNVFVRDLPGGRSSATVNVLFHETYADASGWGDRPAPRQCNSTGEMERRVLDELNKI